VELNDHFLWVVNITVGKIVGKTEEERMGMKQAEEKIAGEIHGKRSTERKIEREIPQTIRDGRKN
jgi:hypothetical protein